MLMKINFIHFLKMCCGETQEKTGAVLDVFRNYQKTNSFLQEVNIRHCKRFGVQMLAGVLFNPRKDF